MPGMGWVVLSAFLILFLIIFSAGIYRDSTRFVRVEYTVNSDKLKKDCKIILLADLHAKSFGEKNEKLKKAIEETNPDLIVVAGDMVTADKEKTDLTVPLELMRSLSRKYPVYYANGNHEYRMKVYTNDYGNKYKEYEQKLSEYGVKLLQNERIYLPDSNMEICGLEIERNYYRRFHQRPMGETYVEGLLGKSRRDCFELLIAHNPDYFDNYAKWGADLTVSGHVHGGIMRLPVLGGVISPMLRLFPKYDGGLFEKDGRQMILSRGLGMHTIPVRIFNPGELVVIHLLRI